MRKIVFAVSSLLATTLLFTACNKDEQYTVPAQDYLQKINGIWYTAASGKDFNRNAMPDADELTPIDSAVQQIYTEFMGNGKVRAYGTFMGSDLDTATGTWLITPENYLKTMTSNEGSRSYFIYQINDSIMILKDTEAQPNRWILYDRK